ncbi:MAG: Fe(2+)-trafficking protein [Chloroflexi bacterium]|nr:Fe(2+)-trafficking protein [Chloroflexota bacterium]
MGIVTCVRCSQTREGAGKVGLPGTLGAEVEERVCSVCWAEWVQTQIKVINHYGLKPVLREDREKLYGFTREFLNLAS